MHVQDVEDLYRLERRVPNARPGPIPALRLDKLLGIRDTPDLVLREAASTVISSSPFITTTCAPNDNSGVCEKPVNSTQTTTIPIVLGVAIPLGVAFIVLIFLHRRHVKNLRKEDANDRYKSLDFGVAGNLRSGQTKNRHRPKNPEMTITEAKEELRRDRGLSMDMTVASPYLLPPDLRQSRESLRSLSRSIVNDDDKYRPATNFIPDDGSVSYPSSIRTRGDDASSFTNSSRRNFAQGSRDMRNPMGLSHPGLALPPNQMRNSYASSNGPSSTLRASHDYLGAFIRGGGPPKPYEQETSEKNLSGGAAGKVEPLSSVLPSPPPAVFKGTGFVESRSSALQSLSPAASKGTGSARENSLPPLPVATPSPPAERQTVRDDHHTPPATDGPPRLPELSVSQGQGFRSEFQHREEDMNGFPAHGADPDPQEFYDNQPRDYYPQEQYDQFPELTEDDYVDDYDDDYVHELHRRSTGIRPLPPDDPSENPEERAIRIRSFYKEYFDESKPQRRASRDYYDGSENFHEEPVYDQYYEQPQSHYYPEPPRFSGPDRHRATTMSGGSYTPRTFSMTSSQFGSGYPRPAPRRKLPPPKPLHSLPTPHKLKDDTFLPIDFAPPDSYRTQRSGTPSSRRGSLRAYSPAVRAHIPLASSYDDLTAMPSPHALRKSATFTGLDFAPPAKLFRESRAGSDSGSVRSSRSGVSALHAQNIRNGAYRLSRIPKEVAGTKRELHNSLRPQWDMRG